METKLKLSNIIENRLIISRKLENIFTNYATNLSCRLNQVNNIINLNQYDANLLKEIINIYLENFNKLNEILDYTIEEKIQIENTLISNKQIIFDNLYSKLKLYWLSNIKFVFTSEKTFDRFNNQNGAFYMVNGIEICNVRKYRESFCSIKNGRPSNIRDTVKTAYVTNWNLINIEKLTGVKPERKTFFIDIYPDTTWGYTGRMISFKEFKETFINFIESI